MCLWEACAVRGPQGSRGTQVSASGEKPNVWTPVPQRTLELIITEAVRSDVLMFSSLPSPWPASAEGPDN